MARCSGWAKILGVMPISRRNLILGGLAASSLPGLLAACSSDGGTTLAPTPSCGDARTTPAQTEGPFFTSGSPGKADLAADVSSGTRLALTGTVLTTRCQPVSRAKLDFWQADDEGEYDNRGFRLRGHVFTDEQGRYDLTTVVPGLYPGRTRHLHVTVQPPSGAELTTQLYFPGEAANARDGIYRPECELTMGPAAGDAKQASFTFVL